ncbi:hypothetical protein ASPBRDRAFT_584433 [Aspergillus brasiliensis CBS 101740]|uniref:Uncharacterized protein n=1 Tax=Aspergillus brasiliensis (strain CBS 101740 / IMI 381727 / IBT 21946) TaxID=767769 RepID=A0A1L9UJX4_ASPBC|nr:hypothetical protein ASPBRDRAFT_584433 [Aspergillus brasiliensis CBS 101740]
MAADLPFSILNPVSTEIPDRLCNGHTLPSEPADTSEGRVGDPRSQSRQRIDHQSSIHVGNLAFAPPRGIPPQFDLRRERRKSRPRGYC